MGIYQVTMPSHLDDSLDSVILVADSEYDAKNTFMDVIPPNRDVANAMVTIEFVGVATKVFKAPTVLCNSMTYASEMC